MGAKWATGTVRLSAIGFLQSLSELGMRLSSRSRLPEDLNDA